MSSIYDMTDEMGMHAMRPARTFDEISSLARRHGVAMWSQLHQGERVLIFKLQAHSDYTLCVLYAEPVLQLSDQQIGQLIVELIGLQYSDDQPADYIRRGEQLRKALADIEENDQVVFMYFYLQFLSGPHPPVVEYMRPE